MGGRGQDGGTLEESFSEGLKLAVQAGGLLVLGLHLHTSHTHTHTVSTKLDTMSIIIREMGGTNKNTHTTIPQAHGQTKWQQYSKMVTDNIGRETLKGF